MKHLLIIFSILLLSSPVIGNSHKGETLYKWFTSSGVVWKGIGDKNIHHVYKGDVVNGIPNGVGILTSPNGSKYIGEFNGGKPNGHGTLTFGKGEWEGQMYVGEFKDGERNGQGKETHPDGDKYVGEFKDGERNGQGTFTFHDGKKV